MQMGQYEDAVNAFAKAVELAPRFEKGKQKLAEAQDYLAHPEKRPATTRSSPATSPSTMPQ
jgi:cytochrome c-type biogenesis protein CcmH/NrfG